MPLGELNERIRHGLRDYRLFSDERPALGRRARAGEICRNVAIGLGARSFRGTKLQFEDSGYLLPLDLADMTGGAEETWDEIARAHLDYYRRWTPIEPDSKVLEIGCGLGRDAIRLTSVLSPAGRYCGLDITRPSIEWCRRNISKRHPNFRFDALDIRSPMYNPTGTVENADVRFPYPEDQFDRVALHSVFTHMSTRDVSAYLKEISRVLVPSGLVLASYFVVDAESLDAAKATGQVHTFEHDGGDGTRLNDALHPEAAIAFPEDLLQKMVADAGLQLRDLHRGFWSGVHLDAPNGQDIAILSLA